MPKRDIEDFIAHWSGATASEQSISQQFLCELCDLLDVPQPGNARNGSYTFEFHVSEPQHDGETKEGRIDLYKRACFVLESKKFQVAQPEPSQLELAAEEMGAIARRKKSAAPVRHTERWDDAMLKALVQAERYTRALPADEPYPPFVLVVDVGHVIEVRADFSLTGRAYQSFPDPLTYRIRLEQLRDEKIRQRLKLIWTNPPELDPSRRSAEVTRDVAKYLAELAKSFEKQGHAPKVVAEFLTRCLFCMFAEDVGLLPNGDGKPGFSTLLNELNPTGEGFVEMLRTLFKEMNEGRKNEISVVLRRKLLKFNGGLFADDTVLPVNGTQLGILKKAASLDWKHVEPAIFGTLLERALGGEGERHKLGAHFTPRAYVERLVVPTVIEPLRAEWENVRAAAVALGKRGDIQGAREAINRFHQRLCEVKVLDPACGSANFLYVTLEHLKRLEGEVLDFAGQFGESFKLEMGAAHTVDPHQFLGLEINPRAAAIAELVLWIGYLQWHFRTRGQTMPAEPVLKKFNNIQCRDAVLAYDGEPQPARDAAGNEITVWDRRSKKTDMVTGHEVPDETKRVPLLTYTNPRPAIWPDADFVVGNPPFIGKGKLREDLGDGYAETLRAAYPEVPESADFVLYWWHKAAELVRAGKVKRFGLITTNSLRQTFARRVVQAQLFAKPPLSLLFAISDHPWVDTAEGAAVRIAMTVGGPGKHAGELLEIKNETPQDDGSAKVTFNSQRGKISADLSVGANLSATVLLQANDTLASTGLILGGRGFVLSEDEAKSFKRGGAAAAKLIYPLRNGEDLTGEPRNAFVIDTSGWGEDELRSDAPAIYQHLLTTVYPERQQNRDPKLRKQWWLFRRSNEQVRGAIAGLRRFIVTVETAKHRFFTFFDDGTKPEHVLIVVGLDDAFFLGVLSSRIHVTFALAAGGTLEDRPRYNKTRCFDPFPFPLCGAKEKERIRKLAEALDAHRKGVQAQHGLTLTGLYNVLEKIRAASARPAALPHPGPLPLGEGTAAPRHGKSEAPDSHSALDTVLPLPAGEGRGEGERTKEPSAPTLTLTAKEKLIHDRGLVSVLKQLHDDLDAAVSAAYGWPATLTDAEILERLVALNAERAAEEKRGVIHWLRPEYQASAQRTLNLKPAKAAKLAKKTKAAPAKRKTKTPWPKALAERVQAVEAALHAAAAPVTPAELAVQFARAKPEDVLEILQTLETLGRAHGAGEGKFRR